MTMIVMIAVTAACFLAAVLNLATESRLRNRITSVCMASAVTLGVSFYGYGFVCRFGASPTAVLRALLAVCRMFAGVNDFDSIQAAPLFSQGWALALFWLAHFMAFYVTANAAVAAVGSGLLRRIRVTLLRRGTLLLIYGVNEDSLEYGRGQIQKKRRSVIFVGEGGDAAQESSIHAMGAVLEKGSPRIDGAFLRRLGVRPGSRRIEIAALCEDGLANLGFAKTLLCALEQEGVHAEQTSLLIRGAEEAAPALTGRPEAYGYGGVFAFDGYDLAARLMIRSIPPCDMIRFDSDGRAAQDFSVVMIGFGKMGRAALNHLIMNGRFAGGAFRADIFDADAQRGALFDHEILKQYDVRFHRESGTSEALYAFLSQRLDAVRCVVLCTGSEKENREIAHDVGAWLAARGASPAIIELSRRSVAFSRDAQHGVTRLRVYDAELLDVERIDRPAMVLNHMYCGHTGAAQRESWARCDYFSRLSSRASADFYPAVLRASGRTAEQVMGGDWPPTQAMLENLAVTEHLRWCAFHHVMGFSAMTEAEFDRRAAQYLAQRREGAAPLRIAKDLHGRRHACLIPWEELDELSEKENAVTGGCVDYKQMDRNNVLALADMLNALQALEANDRGGKAV